MPYLFGDDERALRRLDLLARVFHDSTRELLERQLARRPLRRGAVVVDLGCGPGRTTRLLADVCGQRVSGLDDSPPLLWEARRLGPDRVRFRRHDVAAGRLPGEPADLIFARLLLSHLPQPEKRVATWGESLRPGASLIVEEVEAIETRHAVFVRYLELVATALSGQGGELYVGPRLAALPIPEGLHPGPSEVAELSVPDSSAAAMFRLNLPSIAATESVSRSIDATGIAGLQAALDELAYTSSETSSITWKLRRIAWDRAA